MTQPQHPRPTALVTGASSGLGAEFAAQLAARGDDLLLVARSAERLRHLADRLESGYGIRVETLPQDLADADAARRIAVELAERGRSVDLLINNAGFGTAGRFEEIEAQRDHELLMVNVVALVDLTHELLPGMIRRGHGAIINVGSTAGFQPSPYFATYAATKSFVLNFSLALHAEYRTRGIRVMALTPGPTQTAFFDAIPRQAAIGPMMTPEAVVRAALRGLAHERAYVVPGVPNAVAAHLAPRRPRRLIATMVERITRRVVDPPGRTRVTIEPSRGGAA